VASNHQAPDTPAKDKTLAGRDLDRRARLRNIGIIAHIDAGKTTVTERILFHTGNITRMGNVDDGTTITDFMPQERERGITIQSAAITSFWRDHQINIIDTPGHIDFTSEVQRSLRVLDGGIAVFDGVAGVEPQSETVWHQADRYGVPRICFVNKLDRPGADYQRTIRMIRDRLGANAIGIQMPIGREGDFRGVVDLIGWTARLHDGDGNEIIAEVPEELATEARRLRDRMIEQIADLDDEIAAAYLENEAIAPEVIRRALRRAVIARKAVPCLCGVALYDRGIEPLLDAIVDYLPSPLDLPAMPAIALQTGQEVLCEPDDNAPLAALVFKVVTDPYVGRLAYFRVYSGVVRRGDMVYNATTGDRERVGRLVRMFADRREDVAEIRAGDIGAVLGFKTTSTGDTLCTADLLMLEKITFPAPVMSMAITPASKADEDKMATGLQRLAEEDPTLHVRHNERTGQTVISGMGELHLEVVVDRLLREFRVRAQVGAPEVAYYETITQPVHVEGRLVRQTGGHGQFAHVVLDLEPLPAGSGFVFEDQLRGGSIPREYVPAIQAGLRDGMERGVLIEAPLIDLKATLVDGSYHEVDSSDYAFRTAASMALRDGAARGAPVILEPIMKVEVMAPEASTGDVIGELSSRAGTIVAMELLDSGLQHIEAHVPLAQMFGFATALRSRTQGRGTFAMEFDHYARVNEATAAELIKRHAQL